MANLIPVIGWILSAIGYTSVSLPLWLLWGYIIPKYAPIVPEPYHQLPFFDVVCIVWLIRILAWLLSPQLVKVHTHNKGK